ncbi:acyltransferase [Croceibacter atlanticus]|jgi:maltose O-acetyltransferase|uniref:acyltransferase n=1 Tax=Croceibacter atlanticus TaxID=313588 RepID=UPI0030F576C3
MKRTICLIIYYGLARFLPKSNYPYLGKYAKYFRYILCKNIFEYCGENVNIQRMAFFGSGKKIRIGDFSGLGINCRIHDNTIIGENVLMGPNCYMMANTHLFDSINIPMRNQGRKKLQDQVIFEDDIWIGRDVMIIGSKKIKTGSILGARCVLTKNFPEYSIIGGNPGKLIRNRK